MVVDAQVKTAKRVTGGSFLIEDLTPEDIFTLEDISPEQKQIADLAAKFAEEKISPQVHEIEAKNFDVSRKLMLESGRSRAAWHRCAGAVWRYGAGQGHFVPGLTESERFRQLFRHLECPCEHRDLAPAVVWNAAAEGEISSQAGERRMDRGLRVVRGLRRLGCNEYSPRARR